MPPSRNSSLVLTSAKVNNRSEAGPNPVYPCVLTGWRFPKRRWWANDLRGSTSVSEWGRKLGDWGRRDWEGGLYQNLRCKAPPRCCYHRPLRVDVGNMRSFTRWEQLPGSIEPSWKGDSKWKLLEPSFNSHRRGTSLTRDKTFFWMLRHGLTPWHLLFQQKCCNMDWS